jgi:hypothetical protein
VLLGWSTPLPNFFIPFISIVFCQWGCIPLSIYSNFVQKHDDESIYTEVTPHTNQSKYLKID